MQIDRGKFIVFEGIDGSGKSQQIKKAASFIYDLNYKVNDVYLTREPTKDAKHIRKKLLDGKDVTKDSDWYAKMLVEDRKQHMKNYIMPVLNLGIQVLCDRYKYSTYAFQQAQGLDVKKLIKMHEGLVVPDLVMIFDCDAERAVRRKRQNKSNTEVFDKDVAFQSAVRKNYLEMPKLFPKEKIIVIDSCGSINDIFEEVKGHIIKLYK